MTGTSFKELAKQSPVVARATAIVETINEAAALLRNWRKEANFSQTEMADKLGVSQARVAQLESGKPGNAPSLEQMAEYAFHTGNRLLISGSHFEKQKVSLRQRIRELESTTKREVRRAGRLLQATWRSEPEPEPALRVRYRRESGSNIIGKIVSVGAEGEDLDVHVRGVDAGLHVGDEVVLVNSNQWNRKVSKDELKELAEHIEHFAEEKISARDIFTTVTEVIATGGTSELQQRSED